MRSYFREDNKLGKPSTPRNKWKKSLFYDLTSLRSNGKSSVVWRLNILKPIVSFKGAKETFIVPMVEVKFCAGKNEREARKKAGIRRNGNNTFDVFLKNMKNLEPKIIIYSYESVTLRR